MSTERKKTYNFRKKTSNVYFGKKFSEALSYWKKETGYKQEYFASRIGVTKDMIPRYKKGTIPDDETFLKMINEFRTVWLNDHYSEITESFFIPSGFFDSIKYSETTNNETIKGLQDEAKDIGLNEKFLSFLEENTLFNNEYPLWTNLDNDVTALFTERESGVVRRSKINIEVKIDSPFQVEREGKYYNLMTPDLIEIKKIQDKLAEYANYLFYLRRKEMDDQLQQAKEASVIKDKNGTVFINHLSLEDLQSIDPYTDPKSVSLPVNKEGE